MNLFLYVTCLPVFLEDNLLMQVGGESSGFGHLWHDRLRKIHPGKPHVRLHKGPYRKTLLEKTGRGINTNFIRYR
jgi:hypothetical protein